MMSVRTRVATAHHGLGDDWMIMEWGLMRGILGWVGWMLVVAWLSVGRHDQL